MGRFDPKYSARQRQAIIDAVVHERMGRKLTCPEAVELAKRGALGLQPYAVSLTTAREWCRKERRRRDAERLGAAGKGSLAEVSTGERRRLLAVVHSEIDQLERRKAGKVDLDRALKLADLLKRLDVGAPKAETSEKPKKKPKNPTRSQLAERVMARARESDEPAETGPSETAEAA